MLSSCTNKDKIDANISIPFTLENGRTVLEASIKGQQSRYIFDSGSMISHADISSWGLFPVAYTKEWNNNKLSTVLVLGLNKIQFGDFNIKAHSYLINNSDSITRIKKNEGYNGLLGISIFEGYWCELSFSEQKIYLYKEKPEGYDMYSPANLININNPVDIPITIGNKIVYMTIDTGLSRAILFPEDMGIEKNNNNYLEIISDEEVEEYHLVKTNEIKILDETYKDKYIMTNSYSAKRFNYVSHNDIGLIGLDFLKNYDLLFDYREILKGKTTGMYYKSIIPSEERDYGFFSFLDEVPVLGVLNFAMTDKGLVIRSILKDSTAYKDYGLRPDDVITKINNCPISKFAKEELVDPNFFTSVVNFSILKNDSETTILFSQ